LNQLERVNPTCIVPGNVYETKGNHKYELIFIRSRNHDGLYHAQKVRRKTMDLSDKIFKVPKDNIFIPQKRFETCITVKEIKDDAKLEE